MSTPQPTLTPDQIEALQPLTPSEWEIMHICWQLEEATLSEIVARFEERRGSRDFKVVQLLLRRIKNKGYLISITGNLQARHRPLVPRLPVLRREFERFLSRVSDGDPEMLGRMAGWIEERLRGKGVGG